MMKEATGEVSMTVITLAAIAIIGGVIALFWGPLQTKLNEVFGAMDVGDPNISAPAN